MQFINKRQLIEHSKDLMDCCLDLVLVVLIWLMLS